jgi:tRNA G18 (ribose-2'-O)-methylase SpoU
MLPEGPPKGYLLLHNISKKNNVGTIIRSACAFGLSKVFFISSRPESKKMKILKEFKMFGNQGTYKEIEYEPFPSLEECKEALNKKGIRICGVEIGEGSLPIQSQPFTGSTAFFLGNEGTGMLPVHKKLCDFFVYIPQYTEKTASLNVGVAAGIIFHHFALWAGFEEAKVYGEKYQNQLTEGDGEKEEAPRDKFDEEE